MSCTLSEGNRLNRVFPSKTVLFAANRGFALTSSRLPLIGHFLNAGWHVIAAVKPDRFTPQLAGMGVHVVSLSLDRNRFSPLQDLRILARLARIHREHRPQLTHHFHPKPVILGSLAARLSGDAIVFNSITGLGNAFVHSRLKRRLAIAGYRLMLDHSAATIFQNPDDRDLFVQKGWVPAEKARLIVSSGVDTRRFSPPGTRTGALRVLMVARLLWSKGVREYVEAATQLKPMFPQARFQLAGELEPGKPDAVDETWLSRQNTVEFLGYLDDMPRVLRQTAVFVLPSYYPEGVPRVLLEAAASAVPAVTTDSPGCREAVVDGETGFLVPPRSPEALAAAVARLLEDAGLRRQMGQAARARAEREFDIQAVARQYIALYQSLGLNI